MRLENLLQSQVKPQPAGLAYGLQGENDHSKPLDQDFVAYDPSGEKISNGSDYDLEQTAKEHSEFVNNYLSNTRGQEFLNYMNDVIGKNIDENNIKSGSLEDELGKGTTVAAASPDYDMVLLNENFDKYASSMSQQYDVPLEYMKEALVNHELLHLDGNVEGFKDEEDVESHLMDFYSKKAANATGEEKGIYQRLSDFSKDRLAQVDQNYGREGASDDNIVKIPEMDEEGNYLPGLEPGSNYGGMPTNDSTLGMGYLIIPFAYAANKPLFTDEDGKEYHGGCLPPKDGSYADQKYAA